MKIATVEILREIELSDPLFDVRLLSRDRLRQFSDLEEECDKTDDQKQACSRYFQLFSLLLRFFERG